MCDDSAREEGRAAVDRRERSKGTGSLFKRDDAGPWIAAWMDWNGRRKIRSTRTTDRAAAERILSKHVADAALRREGVIDPTLDRHAVEGRRNLEAHVAEYLAQCQRVGLADEHIDSKRNHLTRIREVTGITRLNELTPDALERYLGAIKDAGRAPRSINFARQIIVTFMSWCVKTGRVGFNALLTVSKQDESTDRRRVRRPLTGDELDRLLRVANSRARAAWYLCAALAGLRRGDLKNLVWSDVNYSAASLTIRGGKAKRIDTVPMNPQLAEALKAHQPRGRLDPSAKVFPSAVTNLTRQKDFLRAGIARREVVLGADGKPVMVGTKKKRPKTRIVTTDDHGRVADLHALRTTLGTQLARAGVAPQIAQKIMRHSDYRTTLAHYTILGLSDTSKAVAALPRIGASPTPALAMTGTDAASPTSPR